MSITTYGFSGKVWGNGQFGIARSREISIGPASVRVDAAAFRHWRTSVSVHGLLPTLDFLRRDGDEYCGADGHLHTVPNGESVQRRVGSIGLSLLPKRHKRGMLGITTHGQKVVRNACKALQDRYGRSRLSFLTVTVPGMSSSDLALIASDWTRIVKVFIQKLKRSLLDAGLSGEIVGVTEVQMGRLSESGQYALHLHLLFQGASVPWKWAYDPGFYREMWFSVLEKVVPRCGWSGERSAENVKSVKFSAEGYLGKYMSKGHKNLLIVKELCPDAVLPSAWWHCTFKLRRHVLRSICHVNERSAAYLMELIETCPDLFAYLKPVRVRMGERDVGVGFCGRIDPCRVEEIRSVLYALKESRLESIGDGL